MRTFQNHFETFEEKRIIESWWDNSVFLVDGGKEQFQIVKQFQNTGGVVSIGLLIKYNNKCIE